MRRDRILLAHGGGGSLTRELIETLFLPRLENPLLKSLDDSAVLVMNGQGHAFTTDSYVVKPYIFPGGDIGKLAVCGTINDLAVMGARPLWLSLSFILEEGLLLADLQRIVESIGTTAREAGVQIVTGDTKVVERGKCEGLYINTAGLGDIVAPNWLGAANVKPGDAVIINGPIGEHGVAVMSQREGIAFQTSVVSDCAPLWPLVKAILDTGAEIRAMRDPTRGGVSAAVCDIARASNVGIRLHEDALPIGREVRGACDLLGLDPLTIPNEGKVLVFCRAVDTANVLAAMRGNPIGKHARVIGEVSERPPGIVTLRTTIGGERIIDMPTGEDLPRIC
ncbi:MAG TPA: hydrogenase expression/formation protein HypE [Verrucomicrobiae bacterium]|nr:hydrogenase expression/formation protein HypE [Verrucomicrobiae bacterium]